MRRIATLNSVDKVWETEIGASFVKEDKAYMVTTNPFASLGMAKPIRIKKVYGEESIENIVVDIYKLSYMHIGSILKSRLPVTTHYADLSSTYGNRELMPSNIDSKVLHFI